MNHARIAAEAIRFRISTIRRPLVSSETLDVDAMAAAAVTAASPEVDMALRVVATAWMQAGFDPEALVRPWTGEQAELFRQPTRPHRRHRRDSARCQRLNRRRLSHSRPGRYGAAGA